jgi:acetyl-CoA C-acetyltransferase
MTESSTPILVGCGDVTDLTTPAEAGRSPLDLIAQAGKLALADTEAPGVVETIDTIAMLRLFSDTSPRYASKLGGSSNPPKSVAQRLGIDAARYIYTSSGGNMPQYMVNLLAESIAQGDIRSAMIAGGEALRTQHGVERANLPVNWTEDPGGQPEMVGNSRRAYSDEEERHNMRAPITIYPLFENAIRGTRGRTISEHMMAMGTLFAGFAGVAAGNPLAVRREGYSAERLATVDEENRWIGFPYPRLMNSNVFVDQAAALVMTSVGLARNLGIPEKKWIYLHGCADATDQWFVSERTNLHSSPAIQLGARKALEMAGLTLPEIRFFDLYSCFPSAVEIGCREIGLAEDDPRGLTVTGGLPYFGGPGNNYVTHSISEMTRQLRANPGSFGLITANGNYVTKHSFGVYSSTPTHGRWRRENPAILQAQIDAMPKAALAENPSGPATIETYTVMHGKNGPEYSVVIGRLNESGRRFVANTPPEPAVLSDLREHDALGHSGIVRHENGHNVFFPE